jgi:hypothetical protein
MTPDTRRALEWVRDNDGQSFDEFNRRFGDTARLHRMKLGDRRLIRITGDNRLYLTEVGRDELENPQRA